MQPVPDIYWYISHYKFYPIITFDVFSDRMRRSSTHEIFGMQEFDVIASNSFSDRIDLLSLEFTRTP